MIAIDILAFALCASGLFESISLPLPDHLADGGSWQFLTNVGSLLTCLYILLQMLIPTNAFTIYFYHIVSAVECAITVGYWWTALFFPLSLNGDAVAVSTALDLQVHLLPYAYLLWVIKPRIRYKESLVLSVFVLGVYWTYIEYLMYAYPPLVPYPFLKDLSTFWRLAQLGKFILLSQINYIIQWVRGTVYKRVLRLALL